MRPALVRRAFVVLLTLAAVACGGGFVDPSKNQTETFSGTVQPGSFRSHDFSTSKMGEFKIVLTSLQPPFTGFVSVGYGVPQSNGCTGLISVNNFVRQGTTVTEGVIQPGNYCVIIADQGTFTTAENYTITVSHP